MCISWFATLLVVLIVLGSQFSSFYSEPDCFQIPSKECLHLNTNKCKILSDGTTAYCCNITSSEELRDNFDVKRDSFDGKGFGTITALHILHSNLSRLDATVFTPLKHLVVLSITDNIITQLHGQFKPDLVCLNLSSNSLSEIDPNILPSTNKKLAMISLSHNNITSLPELFKNSLSPRIDVSGNLQLQCKSLIDIVHILPPHKLGPKEGIFMNRNETTCVPPKISIWMDNNEVLVPLDIIEDTKEIDQDCPIINGVKCDCSVHSLESTVEKGHVYYQAKVDCSNMQLTSLPNMLPKNTKFLNVSANNITSLDGIGNDTYSTIQELYADNNKISSMKPLEGSQFLYDFSVLSLKGNQIEMLQTYMLSNVFDRNVGKKIFLADNYFVCDCNTAQHITLWLMGNKAHVPDNEEIWCSNLHNTKVVHLHHQSVCFMTTDWTDYIHYVIALEIILFLFLIAKVSYDYYVFKSAGYLPWPASKMPKLPCDWCFET